MENHIKSDLERENTTALSHVKRALDKFSRVGLTVSAAENQSITYELMEALLALTAQGANIKHIRVTQ